MGKSKSRVNNGSTIPFKVYDSPIQKSLLSITILQLLLPLQIYPYKIMPPPAASLCRSRKRLRDIPFLVFNVWSRIEAHRLISPLSSSIPLRSANTKPLLTRVIPILYAENSSCESNFCFPQPSVCFRYSIALSLSGQAYLFKSVRMISTSIMLQPRQPNQSDLRQPALVFSNASSAFCTSPFSSGSTSSLSLLQLIQTVGKLCRAMLSCTALPESCGVLPSCSAAAPLPPC